MTLYGVIKETIAREVNNLYTSQICTILEIDKANMRCDIICKVSKKGDGEFAVLKNVPILSPSSMGSVIMMPINKGDTVLALFCRTDSNKALIDENLRKENLTKTFSAVVIGGFVLDKNLGQVIYGDEVYEIPEEGIHIVSDECVRILAPCIDIPSPILQDSEDGVFGTNSNSYQEAFKMNFVTGPWKYAVVYSFEVAQEAPGRASFARVQLDNGIVISEGLYTFGNNNEYTLHGGIYYMDLTSEGVGPNSHYIDFDIKRDSGGTSLIRKMRVGIFKVIENVGCPIP